MRTPHHRILLIFVACALIEPMAMPLAWSQASAAPARICVVRPRAQLGQESAATAEVAEAVRTTLMTYMSGPAAEVVAINSLVPVQVDAEALQYGCTHVVYSSVTQKKSGSAGFAKLVAAAAPIASSLPGVSGYSTTSVAASQAAAAAGAMAQEKATEAIAKASEAGIHKGDQVTLEYKLAPAGQSKSAKAETLVGKAQQDGEDVLSPLIEQAANDLLSKVTGS